MNRNVRARRTASVISSYFMFIFLTAFITGLIIMQTLFSPAFLIRRAESSGFSQAALAEVREKYRSHGAASGIPQEVMDSVLTQRHVDNAIKTAVRSAYGTGSAYAFDFYREELISAFHEYAVSQGISESEEQNMGIDDLAALCTDDFREHVVTPLTNTIIEVYLRYYRIAAFLTIILAAITFSLAILLKTLNRRISMLMSFYIYAFGAAALVCTVIPVSILGSGITKRLGITPESYNRLISSYIEGIAQAYLIALIPLLTAIAVFTMIWIIRRRARRRHGLI